MAVVDGGNASSTYTTTLDGGSASTLFPPEAPTLTPYVDRAPGPRVVVNVTEVFPGTVTATLHRRYDDEDDVVPGADGIAAVGGFVRTDYYPPIGVVVIYQVEMFDLNGASLGYGAESATVLAVPGSTAWVTSPTDPTLSVMVDMADDAGSSITHDVVYSAHQIGGRKVVISEFDYGLTGLPMSFWVASVADARVVDGIVEDGLGLMVFRVAPPMEVPRLLYAIGIPSRQETNLPAGVEDTYFDLTVEEGAAPSTVLLAAVLSYGRYTDNIPTYGEFTSTYGTYRAALLDPPAEV